MMLDWNDYRKELLARIGEIGQISPGTLKGYQELGKAGAQTDKLGAKVRELIALAAAVTLLCSEACPVSGEIVIGGGGHFATARMLESRGIDIDDPAAVTAEAMAARLPEISDMSDAVIFPDALKAVGATFDRVKSLAASRG